MMMKTLVLIVLAGVGVAGCAPRDASGGASYQSYLRDHTNSRSAATASSSSSAVAGVPYASPIDSGYGTPSQTGLGAPDQPVSTGTIGADTLAALKATSATQ